MDVEKLEENIGKKCRKRPLDDKNIGKYKLKPFKSGFKVNTIKGVIRHPKLEGRMAYIFEEDESYVECRRCEVIKPKIKIKTQDEVLNATPVKPKGFWWRDYISNAIFFSWFSIPFFSISIILLMFGMYQAAGLISLLIIALVALLSLALIDNAGPMFSDKYVNIHYYKKRKKIWNNWWFEAAKHAIYLEYKKKLEENERRN